MAKARTRLPKMLEKRVFQQAGSRCPFCGESEVASLQIHHIDSSPNNNTIENLILTCATCHTKITEGLISEAAVRSMKRQLVEPKNTTRKPISSLDDIHVGQPRFVPRRLSRQDMRMR